MNRGLIEESSIKKSQLETVELKSTITEIKKSLVELKADLNKQNKGKLNISHLRLSSLMKRKQMNKMCIKVYHHVDRNTQNRNLRREQKQAE